MDNPEIIDDERIWKEGIQALSEALGPATAHRFMSLASRNETDYVEISKAVYSGQTVEGIAERAKKNWDDFPSISD